MNRRLAAILAADVAGYSRLIERRKNVLDPTVAEHYAYIAASYAYLHRADDAKRQAGEALQLSPTFSIARYAAMAPFARDVDRQHLIEGMRTAGLPE